MLNRKKKGYSLPEIMAAVLIIGILTYMAVPTYNKLIKRSNVSDALHNLDMLAGAQNKYFMSNGRYARDLSSLDTPLKGDGINISTQNYIYSAGDNSDNNFCVYAVSKNYDFMLGKNYKSGKGPLCSGDNCSNLQGLVNTGSLSELCGSAFNDDCDLNCSDPKVLDEEECKCICNKSCGAFTTQNSSSCTCSCIGQAVPDPEDNSRCKCPSSVSASCSSQGLEFDSSKCACKQGCIPTECAEDEFFNEEKCECDKKQGCNNGVTEDSCKLQGKVFNKTKCECEDEEEEDCNNGITAETCEAQGKVLSDCSCVCDPKIVCSGSKPFLDPDTCECTSGETCKNSKIIEEGCTNIGVGFDAQNCRCLCTNEMLCPNGEFDWTSCSCSCNLTDDDCRGQQAIASTDPCQCVPSACQAEEVCPGVAYYDFRACQCHCPIDADYCTAQGSEFDLANCGCKKKAHT